MKLISIIIPCFNEEEVLPLYYAELCRTMDEMKDFMFVVLDDNQVPYAFDLAEDSDLDLSGIAAGDRVVVTYEGELSEVDPFEGTVISVEKAAE